MGTLGARGFSCAVSGVDHVFIVTRTTNFRPPCARKNLWYPGYQLGRSAKNGARKVRRGTFVCSSHQASLSLFSAPPFFRAALQLTERLEEATVERYKTIFLRERRSLVVYFSLCIMSVVINDKVISKSGCNKITTENVTQSRDNSMIKRQTRASNLLPSAV